jgi:hypothetical protein
MIAYLHVYENHETNDLIQKKSQEKLAPSRLFRALAQALDGLFDIVCGLNHCLELVFWQEV